MKIQCCILKRLFEKLSGLLIVVICSGILVSQTFTGTWYDAAFKISLVIKGDGTYYMKHQNGESKGRWGANRQFFQLQDFSGTSTVRYILVKLTSDKLVLKDSNGYKFNFIRQGRTKTNSTNRKTSFKASGLKLAAKNNFVLRESHVIAGIDLIQFIVGQQIKFSEHEELKKKLIEEFPQNPSYILKQLNQIAQSMALVRDARDPVKIGYTRQQIFVELYKATKNVAEYQKPLIIQVINRYMHVLAYDQQNNLVLTNKDVDGMIMYLVFNSKLAGKEIVINESLKKSVKSEMIRNFHAMAIQQKQFLCSASLIWTLVKNNWEKLSYVQKTQYKQMYQQQIGAKQHRKPGYIQNTTNYQPSPKSKKSMAQQMRDFKAKQSMFNMMNNMNMSTHATSLNIIENIGGTGNYWKVVDY